LGRALGDALSTFLGCLLVVSATFLLSGTNELLSPAGFVLQGQTATAVLLALILLFGLASCCLGGWAIQPTVAGSSDTAH